MTDPSELRYRILLYLKDQSAKDVLPELEDIAAALGQDVSAIDDQIDILEDLGALAANRTMGGGAAPMIRGRGKLLIEEIEHELVHGIRQRELESATEPYEWDVFISHASEDKDEFVRELAVQLQNTPLRVWYDEFTLQIGDSLRQSIDGGLRTSRYGVVVLSPNFFSKDWPQWELDGLATLEVGRRKVVLPVWLNVSFGEVAHYSPLLASRFAAKADQGVAAVAEQIRAAMGVAGDHRPTPSAAPPATATRDQTEVEIVTVGARARPPDMQISVRIRHIFGPPVIPLEITVWSALLSGQNRSLLPAYLEPDRQIEAVVTVVQREDSVDVAREAKLTGWRLSDAPDDIWIFFRYRSLDGAEGEVARRFALNRPSNANLFDVGGPTSHMLRRRL